MKQKIKIFYGILASFAIQIRLAQIQILVIVFRHRTQ
jgi:hypothetical protein